MGIINSNVAYTGLVEKYIGTAYDLVKYVADNMDILRHIADLDIEKLLIVADEIEFWYIEAGKSASAAADSAATAGEHVVTIEEIAVVIAGHISTINAALITVATAVTDSQTAQTAAETAQAYSEEWATAPNGTLISSEAEGDGTDYSSLHYAAEALKIHDLIVTLEGIIKDHKDKAETAQGHAETAQGNAETAQGHAETAQGNAETAESNSEDILLDFSKRYMGEHLIAPTENTDKTPLNVGALYFDLASAPNILKAWNGNKWVVTYDLTNVDIFLKKEDHALIRNNPHQVSQTDLDIEVPTGMPYMDWGINTATQNELDSKEPWDSAIMEHVNNIGMMTNPHNLDPTDLGFLNFPSYNYNLMPLTQKASSQITDAFVALEDANDPLGYAALDSEGFILESVLPKVARSLTYLGIFYIGDTLPTASTVSESYFIVTENQDIDLNQDPAAPALIISFLKGDWIISDGIVWEKLDRQSYATITVLDTLTSFQTGDALSANQGRVLNETLQDILPSLSGEVEGRVLGVGINGTGVADHVEWINTEADLGTPANDGDVLISTRAGVRSWTAQGSSVVIAEAAPLNPKPGLLWMQAGSGITYVNYGTVTDVIWVTI